MRASSIFIGLTAAIAVSGSAAAYAQFGGLGNSIKSEAKKEKKKAKKKARREANRGLRGALRGKTPRIGGASIGGGSATLSGAPSSKLTGYTQCAGIPLTKITIGKLGNYTFQQGFSKEKRTGFVSRRAGSTKDCIIQTGLQKDEVLYFELNNGRYKSTRNGSNYTLQCVDSNNPGGGTVPIHGTNGSADQYLGDSHMRLACGNSEGIQTCTNGRNSDRASAHSTDLKKRGKYGASFLARANNLSKRGQSKRLYCQYYNKSNGKSLVAFEMISKSPYD